MSNNEINSAMINTGEDWKATNGSQARVVNESGTSLLDGQQGLLQLQGPGQCVGYTAGLANATMDGWVRANHQTATFGANIQIMNDQLKKTS